MDENKKNAFNMRMSGESYFSISKRLNIPKSTLSTWFSKVDWSQGIKKDLIQNNREKNISRLKSLSKNRGESLKNAYIQAEKEAIEEFVVLKNNPIFIASVMMYLSQGDKSTKYKISVSNSDPNMLRLFSLFLEKVCGVEKTRIRAWILAGPGIDQARALEFWSRTVNLWPTSFTKTIIVQGRMGLDKLPYGVCYVVVSSAYLKKKIVVWTNLLVRELIKEAGMV